MKQDKIQEAYDKMLKESTIFKYMGTTNDSMADFLEEIDAKILDKNSSEMKMLYKIDKDWENLWNKIVKLTRQL